MADNYPPAAEHHPNGHEAAWLAVDAIQYIGAVVRESWLQPDNLLNDFPFRSHAALSTQIRAPLTELSQQGILLATNLQQEIKAGRLTINPEPASRIFSPDPGAVPGSLGARTPQFINHACTMTAGEMPVEINSRFAAGQGRWAAITTPARHLRQHILEYQSTLRPDSSIKAARFAITAQLDIAAAPTWLRNLLHRVTRQPVLAVRMEYGEADTSERTTELPGFTGSSNPWQRPLGGNPKAWHYDKTRSAAARLRRAAKHLGRVARVLVNQPAPGAS